MRVLEGFCQWRFFASQTINTDHAYPNVIQLYTSYAINATLGHNGFIVAAAANATEIHFTISKVQGVNTATTNPTIFTINIGKEP